MVVTSVNGPLENHSNQSFDLYFNAPFPFFNNERLKIGLLLTWDWGNRTWENAFIGTEETSMHLVSTFLTFKFQFLPGQRTNPYLGVGIGSLTLKRIRHAGDNLLDAPGYPKFGIAAIVGSEFLGNRAHHFTGQVKLWRGFGEVAPETYGGTTFAGGDLFGLDISGGIGLKW